ncbi:snRNA-activating protein complex subunit 1, partial [Trichonephila clavata]
MMPKSLCWNSIAENSTEFSVFADKWKAHNFAAVYLGRQQYELQQFTQEIYQITLNYLRSTSFYRRVGTIYLLYALFRNQIHNPPIR